MQDTDTHHQSIYGPRWLVISMAFHTIFLIGGPTHAETTEQTETTAKVSIVSLAETANWKALRSSLASNRSGARAKQPDGTTALHWAAFHDNWEIAKLLIDAGAEVNAETEYNVSTLSLACELGHAKVAKLLIAADARLESKRRGGERPLMLAARQGGREIVESLIAAGAKVDARENKQQTALMWAAAAGHADVIAELLSAGAERDITLQSGFNAFLFAVREGRQAAAIKLLEAGCDIHQTMAPKRTGGRHPRKGMSALLVAVENGHFELAMELVGQGADPNDQRSGFAPLHALTWVRRTKRGDGTDGDPAPRGSGKLTSLQFARAIVKAGAKSNLQLKRGKAGKARLNPKQATPFLMASATCDLPYMNLLLELGADPTLTNADDCNALMAAAGVGVTAVGEEPGTEREVLATIARLNEIGFDINHVDKNGETAMHGAAYRTFPKVVSLIASLGASPDVWNRKNKHKWTPFDIAGGKRPGSVKPSPETTAALDAALTD